MNLDKGGSNRTLSADDEDVKKVVDISSSAVGMVPDIEKLEEKLGNLKPGEKDELLDKLITEIRNNAKVAKHWETASGKTHTGARDTLDKLHGVLQEGLKDIPKLERKKAKQIK